MSLVCRSEDVGDVIREFSDYDYTYVKIDDVSYTNEYVVQITTDYCLYCEPCFLPDGEIPTITETDITFVCPDCDEEVVQKIDGAMVLYSFE